MSKTAVGFLHSAISKSIPDFEKIVGPGCVYSSKSSLKQYSKDEGHFPPQAPFVVLEPKTVDQVSQIMQICNSRWFPVVPFGTGTGLEGGSLSVMGGVCLSTQKMTGDPIVHEQDFVARVKASTRRKTLNEFIRNTGLFFPVDPGADASLCGMVATSASGTNAIRYGTMKENVINLEVVLADGSVLNTKGYERWPRKSSAGLNLTELFVGSEGTLGIITEATLRLHPIPQFVGAAVSAFPDIEKAASAVVEILQWNLPVARIELLDHVQIEACNKYSQLNLAVAPTIFIEFHSNSENYIEDQLKSSEEICKSHEFITFQRSSNGKEMENLWKARHNSYYAALAMKPNSRGFTTDVCVPISRLASVITETRQDLDSNGILGTIVGHVGDGNFHVILPMLREDDDEAEKIRQFSDRLVKRALNANGTCTGEHGVGIGKKKYLIDELGANSLNIMQSIKTIMDPNGIMNPGKLIPRV